MDENLDLTDWVPPPDGDAPALAPAVPPPSGGDFPVAQAPARPPAAYSIPPAYVPVGYDAGVFAQPYAPRTPLGVAPAPTTTAMPHEAGHMLGLSLVLVAVGTAVGARYGVMGAVAGAATGGAAVNVLRAVRYYAARAQCQDPVACEEYKSEAVVSGTYAAIGLVGAGYLAYKVYTGSGFRRNRSGGDDEPASSNPGCRVRPVGP